MLWECYPHDRYRVADPRADAGLKTVWTGFEHLLLERFLGTQRIITPSWEDIYERVVWQEFLRSIGYQPLNEGSFAKEAKVR